MLTAAVLAVLAVLLWPARSRVSGRAPADRRAGSSTPGPSAIDARPLGHRPQRRATHLSGWPWPRRRSDAGVWVADFAEVVAVGLDAGLDLASAALTSARSPTVASNAPWLADRLEASIAQGASVTMSMADTPAARGAESPDIAALLTAWRLSEDLGAGAAAVTRAASATLRSRRAAQERTAAVVAGPRASMWLLTGLPLAGPAVGMLLGVGPASLYGSAPAASSAVVGGLLTAAGWCWGRTLLRRAARAARTDTPHS